MTRKELYREINRIDVFIEVLENFISNPLCTCMTHRIPINDNFTKENKEHLQTLLTIRNFLLPLQEESDDKLESIHYTQVKFTC